MKVLPFGDSAMLLELADLDEVIALYTELSETTPLGVTDLVPAARTLLVRWDPAVTDLSGVERAVRAARPRRGRRPSAGSVRIPVRYDGEDLDEVGELTGLGARGVVEAHTGQEWTVAFCGFAPGFGYLIGEDWPDVPRRSTPRTKVPPGSVAVAGPYSAVYPHESPGGWQLVGRTDVRVWDLARSEPALLTAGVRVRFVERS